MYPADLLTYRASTLTYVIFCDKLQVTCRLNATSPMSYFLPHLPSGWHVDQAILSEDDRVVVIRFGSDGDSQCMKMDETLYGVAEKVQNFAVIYLVDINQVPDFNKVSSPSVQLPSSFLMIDLSPERCMSYMTPVR